MKYKLISCEIFLREASLILANSKNIINPVFLPKGAHENPDVLRDLIQAEINNLKKEDNYDAVLLGYGLCGNVAVGLTAHEVPLVVPRAHDCCSILLGSGKRFLELFGDNPSQGWTSAGYMEIGNSYFREGDLGKNLGLDKEYGEYVEKYGEENAQFIWDSIHPKVDESNLVYIEIPETSHLGFKNKIKSIAKEEGKTLEIIEGNLDFLRGLIEGDWKVCQGDGVVVTSEEVCQGEGVVVKSDKNKPADKKPGNYLIVKPGETISAVYDYEEVITAG